MAERVVIFASLLVDAAGWSAFVYVTGGRSWVWSTLIFAAVLAAAAAQYRKVPQPSKR